MNNQIIELSKGKGASSSPNKYNLQSKKKEMYFDIHDQTLISKRPAKPTTITAKEKKT